MNTEVSGVIGFRTKAELDAFRLGVDVGHRLAVEEEGLFIGDLVAVEFDEEALRARKLVTSGQK